MNNPKISIITVAYNAVDTIEQTILSVLTQSYNNIEYIIVDGGSTDGTVDIIKKYEKELSYWVTEPDNGMYDALVKGFMHVTGDICAYINADDFYQQGAFETVKEIFVDMDVRWLTGINAHYNAEGQIVETITPYLYRTEFVQKGIYGKYLPFIQQESTFWRADLLQYVDMDRLKKFRVAGDFYLWVCFSKYVELNIISCILAGFRLRKGQLSSNLTKYHKEMDEICTLKISFVDKIKIFLDKLCWTKPYRFNNRIIKYDKESNTWKGKKRIER